MRHRSWKLGALLVSMALAVGCSGSEVDTSDTSEVSGAFPVTIEHVFGGTTVPTKPERIVALGVSDADVVLALGQVPLVPCAPIDHRLTRNLEPSRDLRMRHAIGGK